MQKLEVAKALRGSCEEALAEARSARVLPIASSRNRLLQDTGADSNDSDEVGATAVLPPPSEGDFPILLVGLVSGGVVLLLGLVLSLCALARWQRISARRQQQHHKIQREVRLLLLRAVG